MLCNQEKYIKFPLLDTSIRNTTGCSSSFVMKPQCFYLSCGRFFDCLNAHPLILKFNKKWFSNWTPCIPKFLYRKRLEGQLRNMYSYPTVPDFSLVQSLREVIKFIRCILKCLLGILVRIFVMSDTTYSKELLLKICDI